MKIETLQLVELCRKYGPLLQAPDGIDGVRLLWALSGNESSFGGCCDPRHEPAYCRGGKYYDKVRSGQRDGCMHHMSFGPWQVMSANALGWTPKELYTDFDVCAQATLSFLNRRIFAEEQARTLSQVADAYNSGNWRDAIIPQDYIDKLIRNYDVEIPDSLPA